MLVHQSRCAIVQTTLQESRIFSSLRKAQNLDSSRGLVKISASCFLVLTWWFLIFPLASWSLKKWCRMSMCLVLEWLTGLLANFMAFLLSHKSGILVKWHPKSWRVCFIQSSLAQHTSTATYSASAVERLHNVSFYNSKTLGTVQGIDMSRSAFSIYFATSVIEIRIPK